MKTMGWPDRLRCVFCGRPVVEGQLTCDADACSEAKAREMVQRQTAPAPADRDQSLPTDDALPTRGSR